MSNPTFKPLTKAQQIIKRLHVRTLSSGNWAQLVSYDKKSGLYTVGDKQIKLAAQSAWGKSVKEQHIREIMSAIVRNAETIDPRHINNPERQIIVFKNGVLDLKSGELKTHSPEWLHTIGIPHNYNSEATCVHFERFIGEVLPLEAHRLVKQLLGFLLIPSTDFRKFFVFLGEGANGKSTLLKVIEAMLGAENVSHQSLHALGDNRFASFELFGKLANIYADLEDYDVRKTGFLKQITAGDTISYERKFKDPFSAPVTARLVFSANRMPRIADESEAISDRIILVDFPYRFEEAQQDKKLIYKLTAEEEIEGILAKWAIPGLKKLLSKGQFDIPRRGQELLQVYRRQCDPFSDFVHQRLEAHPDRWITRQDLYDRYACWCDNQEVGELSYQEFNRRISAHFKIPNNEWRAPKTRQRAWPGIGLTQRKESTESENTWAQQQCGVIH